jgi:glucose-1-phosphate cytidylyltransferase
MRVVILAGGLGTRLSEETDTKPKPMVEIGEQPILWHIMKHYAHFGVNEFFIALGYKGEMIKRFMWDYFHLNGSMTIDGTTRQVEVHDQEQHADWRVHLVDTGRDTMTGGRVKRLEPMLKDGGTFMLTYGDGVGNIDVDHLLRFHRSHGRIATITAVRPPARFGGLVLDGDNVAQFSEKPQTGEGWINGGFMVFEPGVFEYMHDDKTVLESDTLEQLAAAGQLAAYRHDRFWQCMDTLREKRFLESLWQSGQAPWKVWDA